MWSIFFMRNTSTSCVGNLTILFERHHEYHSREDCAQREEEGVDRATMRTCFGIEMFNLFTYDLCI